MKWKKILAIGAKVVLLSLFSDVFSQMANAQEVKNGAESSQPVLPTRRIGGGTRGDDCIANYHQLVALTPENSVGLTASNSPTIYLYIPETRKNLELEFVLRNSNDELVYENTLTATGKSGVIGLKIPTNKDSSYLELNQNYRWYFSLICNPQDRSQDIVVEGWIERVELHPTIALKLNEATDWEKAKIYQEANLWYEAIETFAQFQNFHLRWREFSQDTNFRTIAKKSLDQPIQ